MLSGIVLLKIVESLIWCKESLSTLLCSGCVRYNGCIALFVVESEFGLVWQRKIGTCRTSDRTAVE